ncbi:MAG: hypothetical protein IJU95_08390 [Treponema sp.]|nr:hypothetical protein [Treponema sp.]
MMTAVKAYYDGASFVPLQQYTFKPWQQVLIVVDDEPVKSKSSYSSSLAAFRARYADFLGNPEETAGLDSVFDNVRDKDEPLRGTEAEPW